ncbi:hypothetical protein PanWU01x14_127120 [Parasponia andersonii]|uniref:Uncharacterized protein n=1 Tax=Parasponia andersonii TaxID=3476 RepID=A0A2P5CT18_PARAD|nr:hypothetical protein PanWU01x14_127120 [Parasponia andersonii]
MPDSLHSLDESVISHSMELGHVFHDLANFSQQSHTRNSNEYALPPPALAVVARGSVPGPF